MKYRTKDRRYGFKTSYDCWETLCNETLEIAGVIAQEKLYEQWRVMAEGIADEMLETVETCD